MLPARWIFAAAIGSCAYGQVMSRCVCDPARPETMTPRECSLSQEAIKQPPQPATFFLKDINPRKPGRSLAIPRKLVWELHELTPEERAAYWTDAIAKARQQWGDDWGLALNGVATRTQCQLHIHIGKLIPGLETDRYRVVDSPAAIPLPENGSGLWVIPFGGKYKVFLGEIITESVLLR